MSRIVRLCMVLAAALSPAACILFENTDDLTGGTGSEADATPDAPGDGPIGDEPPFVHDASAPGDGSAPTCDAQLCESFDLSNSLPGVFTPAHMGDGGTIAIVPLGLSRPNAVEFDQQINSGFTENAIVHTFPDAPPAFHCELDIQFETDPQVNNELDFVVVSAQGINHAPLYAVILAKYGPTWTIAEYSGYDDGGQLNQSNAFTAPPKIGAWTHLVFDSNGSRATASFDGNTLGILPSLSSVGSQTATSRSLNVGSPYMLVNTAELKMLVDNVACSFLP